MRRSIIALTMVVATAASVATVSAGPISFKVKVLAADEPGIAKTTDPDLVNPWGITASPTSPFWLGVNGSGTSEIFNGAGVKQGLVVTIPGDGSVTGTTFSGVAGAFNSDAFLFVSEDGTFSGWRGALGTNAENLGLADPANVYKGLAVATVGGHTYAYAANFRAGTIDVKKGDALAPDLAAHFSDPGLPAGYAPFNIANLGGTLFVAFAKPDGTGKDDVPGPGNGIVDRFDTNGVFLGRVVNPLGDLNSPWGLALAPAAFGPLAGDLLVGNFGDGQIHAYDPLTGAPAGALLDGLGNPIVIDGLWGLAVGNDHALASSSVVYFTAGPGDEQHGRFGALAAVPEPASLTLMVSGLCAAAWRRRRNG